MVEEPVTWGMKTIKNRNSIRATQTGNPSFMLSLDGKPDEDTRQVIAGKSSISVFSQTHF